MANRYTEQYSSKENSHDINYQQMLLDIMQTEYPDDIVLKLGGLRSLDLTDIQLSKENIDDNIPEQAGLIKSIRTSKGVVQVKQSLSGYTKYNLSRSVPTIDDEELDEIIDEEWEFFLEDEEAEEAVIIPTITAPAINGIFLVNSETDLDDYHDLYISNGPQNLKSDDAGALQVFCVFYIDHGTARPIPNYKTLEVMLVERGLTYTDIGPASTDDIKDYDLLLDGQYNDPYTQELEEQISPIAEFSRRQVTDRTIDWNYNIRYKSGYIISQPFIRDPGDYIQSYIDGTSFTQISELSQQDRYHPRVFETQTYLEKMREIYEGKMVINEWPIPYDGTAVSRGTSAGSDDLINNLRMLTLGHWKQVTDSRVIKKYAYLNEISLGEYDEGDNDKESVGRYGREGLINLLLDGGGVVNIPTTNGDTAQGQEPLWNAFSHIIEVDRLDEAEYDEYINNYNNNNAPFDISYLKPYEPAGSIKYYNEVRYQQLAEQALEQSAFSAVKSTIIEIWPGINALLEQTKITLDSAPLQNIQDFVTNMFSRESGSPLFKIWVTDDGSNWKYKKKSNTKKAYTSLGKIFKKTHRIRSNMTNDIRRDIVNQEGGRGWGLFTYGEKVEFRYPDWTDMDQTSHYYNAVTSATSDIYANFLERASNNDLQSARTNLEQYFTTAPEIDNIINNTDDINSLQGAYNDILSMQSALDSYYDSESGAIAQQSNLEDDISSYIVQNLRMQYNSIEYIRKKVNERVGNRGKFWIKWPSGPQTVLSRYIPGLNYNNHEY